MALLDPTSWQPRPLKGGEHTVTEPATGEALGTVALAAAEDVAPAAEAARAAQTEWARLPHFVRAGVLRRAGDLFTAHADELRAWLVRESGSIPGKADFELHVAAQECYEAAALASRPAGQVLPSEAPRLSYTRRVPVGVVGVIAPFNAPLILSIRSVAPALALGNGVVLKPDPRTAVCGGLSLAAVFAEAGLPEGLLHVLPGGAETGAALVADPRVPVISFTGSEKVGYAIMDSVPRKHCTLELGGNGAAVVLGDWASDEDLDWAATRIATFSNYQGGQSCISVQRVIADASVHCIRDRVSEDAAKRVEAWVQEAVEAGAALLTGGKRDGAAYAPTVLTDLPAGTTLACEEVFGPVLSVQKVDGEAAAFAAVNDSKYGLQAGVFTHDLQAAFRAHRALEVGGVVIGDVPSYRADQMPYGGAKQSGVGREGVRFAMDDYTYERVLVLTGLAL